MTLDTIRSDFAFLDDWENRYRYVIELGRGLPPFPEAYRTHRYKVRGCASQVWLATETERRADGAAMLRLWSSASVRTHGPWRLRGQSPYVMPHHEAWSCRDHDG